MNIEIEPAQIRKIVAYAHLEPCIVIPDPIVGYLRKGIIGGISVLIVPEAQGLDSVEVLNLIFG